MDKITGIRGECPRNCDAFDMFDPTNINAIWELNKFINKVNPILG